MKQLKAMPEVKIPPAPRFRYWTTPPEFLTLRVSDIEAHVPKANWIPGSDPGRSFQLPAATVLGKNVPRISLRQLADVIPDCVLPSDGMIKLPASRLATAYELVVHSEELPPEIVEEPEEIAPPEPVQEEGVSHLQEPTAGALESELPVPAAVGLPAESTASGGEATHQPLPPMVPPAPLVAPKPTALGKVPPRREGTFIGLPIFRRKSAVAAPVEPATHPMSPPFSGIRLPRVQGAPIPHPPAEAAPEAVGPAEVPTTTGAGLGVYAAPTGQNPILPGTPGDADACPGLGDEAPSGLDSAAFGSVPEPAPESAPEAAYVPVPEPPHEPVLEAAPEPAYEPAPEFEVSPEPAFAPEEPSYFEPVRMLATETMSDRSRDHDITEQGPLQALFLTDEEMSVGRVIELCGGLPGINSCVLAHGSVVVASHNVPEGVDLVSMSAHAAEMLQAMRESSARMGVGTVPAVTLHTEKGVISFFHRDDLTMLVFHRDRGFIPGVREKMAAVLGELTKARLTLPVGGNG